MSYVSNLHSISISSELSPINSSFEKRNIHLPKIKREIKGQRNGASIDSIIKDDLPVTNGTDFLKPVKDKYHKVKRLDARKNVRNLPKITKSEMHEERRDIVQNIVHHSNHIHHIDRHNKNHIKIARGYLKFITAFQSIRFLAAHLQHNQRIDSALHQKAGNIIIRLLRKRVGMIRRRFYRLDVITRKYSLNWIIKYRCRKKRNSVCTLAAFLTDLFSYRLPVRLAQLRLSAIRLQRYIRSFCRISEARRKVLNMLWIQLEKYYNATIIPALQEKIQIQRQKRTLQVLEEMEPIEPVIEKYKNGKRAEVTCFPSLVQGVHTASFLMARLNHTIKKGQRLIDRCPPDSLVKGGTQSTTQQRAQRKKEIISQFLEDIRLSYKVFLLNQKMKKKSETSNLTVEDAKRMIQSQSMNIVHEIMFPKKHKLIQLQYPTMLVYTGSKRLEFQRLVEDFLRADLGLPSRDSLPSISGKNKPVELLL